MMVMMVTTLIRFDVFNVQNGVKLITKVGKNYIEYLGVGFSVCSLSTRPKKLRLYNYPLITEKQGLFRCCVLSGSTSSKDNDNFF